MIEKMVVLGLVVVFASFVILILTTTVSFVVLLWRVMRAPGDPWQ